MCHYLLLRAAQKKQRRNRNSPAPQHKALNIRRTPDSTKIQVSQSFAICRRARARAATTAPHTIHGNSRLKQKVPAQPSRTASTHSAPVHAPLHTFFSVLLCLLSGVSLVSTVCQRKKFRFPNCTTPSKLLLKLTTHLHQHRSASL